MTFKDLINARNINDEIYDCDVDRFFGLELIEENRHEKRHEIKKALMEIVNERA